MSANKGQEAGTDPANEMDEQQDPQRSGAGAASALETMKAQHAMRKHHGPRSAGPGHEEDQTPER